MASNLFLNNLDIVDDLKELSKKRPVFHSEDDFKFAFAWHIKDQHPDVEIFLERPTKIDMVNRDGIKSTVVAPIDIVLKSKGKYLPIELKYKTLSYKGNVNAEEYDLKDHSAIDEGRYRFRKDIYRVEKFIKTNVCDIGYVIQLTNNDHYKDNITGKNNYDRNYSMHDGYKIPAKDKNWNYENKKGIKRGRDSNALINESNNQVHWTCKKENFYCLNLENDYTCKWIDYSKNDKDDYCFNACYVVIKK